MQATRARSKAEPVFHPDSYGYRAGRSALDAVGQSRRRYWRAYWHAPPARRLSPGPGTPLWSIIPRPAGTQAS
jgi:hypothetical protein